MQKLLELIKQEIEGPDKYNIMLGDYPPHLPASYNPIEDVIKIQRRFIDNPHNDYPESMLIVILYHEIGHSYIHRLMDLPDDYWRSAEGEFEDEYNATEFALKKCFELYKLGGEDRLPLLFAVEDIFKRFIHPHPQENQVYKKVFYKIMQNDIWKDCISLIGTT